MTLFLVQFFRNVTRLKLLCIVTFIHFALHANCQNESYYVIHVKGIITNVSSKTQLKVGDVIKATDKISFNPKSSKAVLISTQKGRFTLGPPAKASPSPGGEFITFIKNTLIPVTSAGNLSTRGHSSAACTNDLKKTLGNTSFIFPDDKVVLCIDRHTYPMNENRFFIYRTHNGDRETNFVIPFSEDSLFIEQAKFHNTNSDQAVEKKADIYYYDKTQNSSVKITSIIPVYVPAEELKTELSFLIQFYQKQQTSRQDILTLLAQNVAEIYGGPTDEYMLERWLAMKGISIP